MLLVLVFVTMLVVVFVCLCVRVCVQQCAKRKDNKITFWNNYKSVFEFDVEIHRSCCVVYRKFGKFSHITFREFA